MGVITNLSEHLNTGHKKSLTVHGEAYAVDQLGLALGIYARSDAFTKRSD